MGQIGFRDNRSSLARVKSRLNNRTTLLPIAGRYCRLPKRLQDDYTISETVLGCGANGQVVLGNGKTDRREVAVKTFRLNQVNREQKEQLVEEAAVFLAMDHPHVARLLNVYESRTELHLVMECLTGGELFTRVLERKTFAERTAAESAWQMLLALNYIHSHEIVHRDIKLENFLYEAEDSDHLKLIDFGFSKFVGPNTKMAACCGSLAYVAPEVLRQCYTSQCDMWSFGVVMFIVLFGYMPFDGSANRQMQCIKEGRYAYNEEIWNRVSNNAQDFVKGFLEVDPQKRLTADHALKHAWIVEREKLNSGNDPALNQHIMDGLCSYGSAPAFRRACMSMMAWSLTIAERAKVRNAFLELDLEHTGAIKFHEFKSVLQDRFGCDDETIRQMFLSMSASFSDEIHYSDFLAAMVCSARVEVDDDLLKSTFRRFDTDGSGYITLQNLRDTLGDTFGGVPIEKLLHEADTMRSGKINYTEWLRYMRGGDDMELMRRKRSSSIALGRSTGSGIFQFHFEPEKTVEQERWQRLLRSFRRRKHDFYARLGMVVFLCVAWFLFSQFRSRGLTTARWLVRKALRRKVLRLKGDSP